MIYIILGMHKSGTTLISEMLHHSGIHMGDFDISENYDSGNKYERKETKYLNIKMLKCGNSFSLNVIKKIDDKSVKKKFSSQIKEILSELNKTHRDWGFKDPRTCLTFPVWHELLNSYRLIAVYRDPLELWNHYKHRCSPRRPIKILMTCWNCVKAWYIYNRNIINYIKKMNNRTYIVINYNDFMNEDMEFDRLSRFINLPLNDRRDKSLYRSKKEKSFLYNLFYKIQKVFFSRDIDALLYHYKTLKPDLNKLLVEKAD